MGVVRLVESGKIYEDDFSTPTLDDRWEVLPNDPTRYEIRGGSLWLYHGDSPLYLFFSPLTEINEFVLDVKNNYNPDIEGCYGGIVVFVDNQNYIEIEEYLDTTLTTPTLKTYPWIRLIRHYNTYSAYWSDDGEVWFPIGQASLGGTPKIGLFVRGTPGCSPMEVEYIRITRGKEVVVDNLVENSVVELLDEFGNVVESKVVRPMQTHVSFNFDNKPYPFKGNFSIQLPDGNKFQVRQGENILIHKGDLFYFEVIPDLYYREWVEDDGGGRYVDVLLFPNQERFLGYLKSGQSFAQNVYMFARNPFISGSFRNVKIEITDGQEKVQIAPDIDGQPGVFSGSIMAFEIPPGTDYGFWVRMEREDSSDRYTSQVRFSLKVSSEYI